MTRYERAEVDANLRKRLSQREYYRKHAEEIKATKKEQYEERRRDFAVTGLCAACGKFPAVKGLMMCEACREKRVEYIKRTLEEREATAKKRREKLHAEGLCVECGKNPSARGRHGRKLQLCEECRKKSAAVMKAKRDERIAGGICTRCGKAPAREGMRTCFDCARKDAVKAKLRHRGDECPESFEGEEFYLGEPTRAKCLACEIPEKYCMGERCVVAYRRWKSKEWQNGKEVTE